MAGYLIADVTVRWTWRVRPAMQLDEGSPGVDRRLYPTVEVRLRPALFAR